MKYLKRILILIFLLNSFMFFFQAVTKNVYAPLLVPLKEAFLISDARAGLLVTLVFLGYALVRFPSGILTDLWGSEKVIILGSALMGVSLIFVGLAPGYYSFAFLTFIMGASSGLYITAGYTLAVIIGSRNRAAMATALFESFGSLAGIFSPLAVNFFIENYSWNYIFFIVGVAVIIATTWFAITVKKTSFDSRSILSGNSKDSKKASFRETLAMFGEPKIRKFIIWATLVGGLGAMSWTGFMTFIPTFFVEARGMELALANQLFTIKAVTGLLGRPGIAWLADHFGTKRIMVGNLLVAIILFIWMTIVTDLIYIIIVLCFLGVVTASINTLINSFVLRQMPEKYQGTGFGLFCTLYTIIYSFGPYFTGFISERAGIMVGMRMSILGAVVAVILIVTASKKTIILEQT